ncbi:MAG: ABC transporter permease [Campylobacterales bacterium]|nr:ABC transporter permease [Campylobacterales bacterium]
MSNNLILFLIKKYIKFDKTQPFISISAILAFIGVALGVMVLLIAMGIMNGFDKEFERKLFTMNYPLTIYPKTKNSVDEALLNRVCEQFPKLKLSPYLTSQVILKHSDQLEGGLIFGVDFKKEVEINDILKEAVKSRDIQGFELIIGKKLYESLYIKQNDKVTLIFTNLEPTGFAMTPTMKRFSVENYFHSGLAAYDKAYIYTDINALQKILKIEDGYYDGIHIFSENPFKDIEELKKILPQNVGIVGWWQQNGNFFAALQMEKRALFIVLMLIILVASLNIISSLLMTVMNRRKEIALLLSLGAKDSEIKKSFFYLGMIIGFSGIVAGVSLGLFGIYLLSNFDIVSLPADVYGTAKLPIDLAIFDFWSVVIGSIFIVIVSSYYPAKKATEIDVLNVLRYE